MSENTTESLIGALVLAVAGGFFYFMMQVTGISATSGYYELTASFRSAQGVNVGTEVRMAGVKVGTITDLTLNPQTYRADARFTVLNGLALSTDTQILISTESLLGGTYVEIVPGGAPDDLADGDEIEDTQGAISVVTLLLKFVSGGGE